MATRFTKRLEVEIEPGAITVAWIPAPRDESAGLSPEPVVFLAGDL